MPEPPNFDRHFPVYPRLDRLENQAAELLEGIRANDPGAVAEWNARHPESRDRSTIQLDDARDTLAHSYGIADWDRLVLSTQLIDAIRRDDLEAVRELVIRHPHLLTENARATVQCNWGPPISYAANLGRDRIIAMLHAMGATDLQHAFERACLQGQLETARLLHTLGARPTRGSVMGPCETQNGAGLALQLELGAELCDSDGDRLAPLGLVLETYCRNPEGKHRCLDIFAENGYVLPDTPPMAVHRGRLDLLEAHMKRDPRILTRTFSHAEIYPRELGCHEDETLALHGTPLAGGTLLHLCVDNDEIEIARWLIENGADVNTPAALDSEGFGGHTALFGCVVSQTYRTGLRTDDGFARLLLDHGADTTVRASLRKPLRFVEDETCHEYHNVTAAEWGERFHNQDWVNPAVVALLRPE